jgi:hypothetical protein
MGERFKEREEGGAGSGSVFVVDSSNGSRLKTVV